MTPSVILSNAKDLCDAFVQPPCLTWLGGLRENHQSINDLLGGDARYLAFAKCHAKECKSEADQNNFCSVEYCC